jgi:DNA-binding PadR family transcriptional regulator
MQFEKTICLPGGFMPSSRDPTMLLPLKPDVLMILTVLARGERHGYAIMQEAERLSDGALRLQPGALYRRLAWMLDEGLLEELNERPAEVDGHDGRRRYYGVTPFGARVAAAEARRMAGALTAMRRAGLTDAASATAADDA